MRVVLARPYAGHDADETVDLPDAEAKRLLADGRARKPSAATPAPRPPRGPRPEPPTAAGYLGPVPPSADSAFAGPTPSPDAGEGESV